MPAPPQHKFAAILQELSRHNVDYIVVGGVAAVLEGAPINTFDVDIVHSRSAKNVLRLLAALESLDACDRMRPERKLRPNSTHLAAPGHSLLITRFGPLDVRGSIGRSHDYKDLLPRTLGVELDEGLCVRVLDLETLIAIKEEARARKI